MVLNGQELLFRKELLNVLREIRDQLKEANRLQSENNTTYTKIEDKLAAFDESHVEFEQRSKSIDNELKELNRSVEDQ